MARVEIESEITGNVWKIEKQVGDHVEVDDVIMILESMKMEIPVEATEAGTLTEILVEEEQQVNEDQVVAIVESD
ncbi:MAG: acetyl-CoA carboxylase biotin carboxyl carrier protein [Patiriisocius sp.]|jgi:acetyl-CoA carboxylase biotin carboxyl carrier protein